MWYNIVCGLLLVMRYMDGFDNEQWLIDCGAVPDTLEVPDMFAEYKDGKFQAAEFSSFEAAFDKVREWNKSYADKLQATAAPDQFFQATIGMSLFGRAIR